jgi:hypothetical protein
MSGHKILQEIAREPEMDILDPGVNGVIPIDRSFGVCNVISTNVSGGGVRVLANPERPGIVITVNFQEKNTNSLEITGSTSATTSAATKIGSINGTQTVKMTCADAGDTVSFISTKFGADLIWNVFANNGGTLS